MKAAQYEYFLSPEYIWRTVTKINSGGIKNSLNDNEKTTENESYLQLVASSLKII